MSSANFIEEIHPDNEEEIEIHNVFANLKKDFEGKASCFLVYYVIAHHSAKTIGNGIIIKGSLFDIVSRFFR